MPLNDLLCKNSQPKDKDYQLTDERGLYLLVKTNGTKSWRLKYQLHGKYKRISIGLYPTTTLADARQEAETIRKQVKQNIDPKHHRAEEKRLAKFRANQTLKAVALEWWEYNLDSWSSLHADAIKRRLEYHVFPTIGHIPIHLLTPSTLVVCLQKIEKSSPEGARRILAVWSKIFHYAGATGRLDTDLTFGLKGLLKRYKRTHYASIEVEELPEFLQAINRNDGRLYKQTILALRLILLTAVRTSELINAKWDEIDFEKKMWFIPAERMKMSKPHLVPLSRQSLEILNTLREMNGHREFVFPSIPRPRKPMSNATILRALERIGYAKKMTGHGARALFMGICKQELGYRHEVPDRQLAHEPKSSVDRAYDRASFLQERVEMMQRYADYLDFKLKQPQQEESNDRNIRQPFQRKTVIDREPDSLYDRRSHAYLGQDQPIETLSRDKIRAISKAQEEWERESMDARTSATVH